MSLTPDDVRRLARLARIAIEPADETAVLEPMAHAVDTPQRLRPDEVRETDQRAPYQSVAPAVEEGLYLVPKVIE